MHVAAAAVQEAVLPRVVKDVRAASSRRQSFQEKLNEYSSVKKVIGVVSGKGGVGKIFRNSVAGGRATRSVTYAKVNTKNRTDDFLQHLEGRADPSLTIDHKIDILLEQLRVDVERIDEYRGILHTRRHIAARRLEACHSTRPA